jgi:dTDP-4-amino-4,6-dideoxygalactose transaminase
MSANKIIGGNHGLPDVAQGQTIKPLSKNALINGRSCLHSIIKHLGMPTIWMPSYLCESLLHPSYDVNFYRVDKSLAIDESFLLQTKPSDVVLVIDYFGFTQSQSIFDKIKSRGCASIEDASQSLLSERCTEADFTIYSLTKCLGLPDGGMIASKDNSFHVETLPPPPEYIQSSLSYRKKRADFDKGQNAEWYSTYLSHKKNLVPVGPYAMSDISSSLYASYDHIEIIQRTRENYEALQQELTPIKKLESGVCPIGFPLLHEDRDNLLARLIENKIYPPVHWTLKKVPSAFSDSHWVSKREITLPCDHRYNREDMEKIIKCVKTL